LGQVLDPGVERELDVVARHVLPGRADRPQVLSGRVDLELLLALSALEPPFVGPLDAALPDDVTLLVALSLELDGRELLGADLTGVPEDLRGETAVRVRSHRE